MVQLLFGALISISGAIDAADNDDLDISFILMKPEHHAKLMQPNIKQPTIIPCTSEMIKEATAYDADVASLGVFITFLYKTKIKWEKLHNEHLRAYVYWETIEDFLNQKFYYNANLKDKENQKFYCKADDPIIHTIFGIGLSLRGIPPVVTSNGILKKEPIDLINSGQATIIDGVHDVMKVLVIKYHQQKASSLYNEIPPYKVNLFPAYAPLLLTMEIPESIKLIRSIPSWCEQMKLYASTSHTQVQLKAVME
jgi:hypothetical protein